MSMLKHAWLNFVSIVLILVIIVVIAIVVVFFIVPRRRQRQNKLTISTDNKIPGKTVHIEKVTFSIFGLKTFSDPRQLKL